MSETRRPGRVVIFGPFIGEFGWELLFWQGVVRRLCRSEFKDDYRIAVSRPGYEAFYPEVHEFVEIPKGILPGNFSAKGYFCDGWVDGHPGFPGNRRYLDRRNLARLARGKLPTRIEKTIRWDGPSIKPLIDSYCEVLRSRYDAECVLVTPFQEHDIDGLRFGVNLNRKPRDLDNARPLLPPFSQQALDYLKPAKPESIHWVQHTFGDKESVVAVFPRSRSFRRPERNWTKEKYLSLIHMLQADGHTVALLGEPSGAHFSGEDVAGCVSLIDIEPSIRFDRQIAALQRSRFAVGALSGSLLVALAVGTPSVVFGVPEHEMRLYRENYMNTPLSYVAEQDPNPDDLWRALKNFVLLLKH